MVQFDSITVIIFAILLKLASMIGLIYMSWIVLSVAEENRPIGISILFIIASYLLIIRNYFSDSIYLYECELENKGGGYVRNLHYKFKKIILKTFYHFLNDISFNF